MKATGATYTPPDLAAFVAVEMVREAHPAQDGPPLLVLDPAVGEGELLASLLRLLPPKRAIEAFGFDHDDGALRIAADRLSRLHARTRFHAIGADFLAQVLQQDDLPIRDRLVPAAFDLVIANPPYVRTQVIGTDRSHRLASQFGLSGRVDLYHAFLLAIARVLRPRGVAGIIVSNRFMTTKAGAGVRKAIREQLHLKHVWDLGDTRLFDAAVLPAVLLASGRSGPGPVRPRFSSIYEAKCEPAAAAGSVIGALQESGVVRVPDGRCFRVQHGTLDSTTLHEDTWRMATAEGDAWLATVGAHTWATFGGIGRVRVGVKTCADRVFIRDDWDSLPKEEQPELLRPLTTHHVGRRFRPDPSKGRRRIVYPHECVEGRRRAVSLADYPRTRAYLERHRRLLESRRYVLDAGREWYEIWVPQDPDAWSRQKLVFRDISEEPCFWIDQERSVVNGDCYWMICERGAEEDLLWLAAAVGNSRFAGSFYDRRFNNKLYAGRRRFMTQYVEKFPLPDPTTRTGRDIVGAAKSMYASVDRPSARGIAEHLEALVWKAFGLRESAGELTARRDVATLSGLPFEDSPS